MPWIRFGPGEPPAPSMPLANLHGQTVAVNDFRGRAALVIAFLHGVECPVCRGVAETWASKQHYVQALGGELLIASPGAGGDHRGLDPAHTLLDIGLQLRDRYARLLEFETGRQVLVFVLDEHGAPYAAWVGAEPDEGALWFDVLRWLQYVSIQCPE